MVEALTPFVLAAAFAYVLDPTVSYFEARGLRREHLVIAAYLSALLIGIGTYAGIKSILVDQVQRLNVDAPVYFSQLQKFAGNRQEELTRRLPLPPRIAERALDAAVGGALERLQALPAQTLALLPLMMHILLVPFIGFFFLLDAPRGFERLIQAAPSRFVEQALHLSGEIDLALGNYLRGILIVAAVIATASFLGLVLLGVNNAFAIAALSGLCSFVPYMGVVAGTMAGGLMAWHQFGVFSAFLKVCVLFLGIRAADEIFLQPVIQRHSVHLHPMVCLLALVLGGHWFGFLGLVFAIPAACIMKALFKVGWSWYVTERGLTAPTSTLGRVLPYT